MQVEIGIGVDDRHALKLSSASNYQGRNGPATTRGGDLDAQGSECQTVPAVSG